MRTSRRRFLAWLGLGVGTIAGAAWLGRGSARRWLAAIHLAPGPTGALRASTAATLRATVLALLDERAETSHYLAEFEWRARRLSGARDLYERYERAVDRAARRAGHAGFRSAPLASQRRIVEALLPARGMRQVGRVLFARDDSRFARHVVRAVFRRFARTDAWLRAGYTAWPGMPRALASLEQRGRRP